MLLRVKPWTLEFSFEMLKIFWSENTLEKEKIACKEAEILS